MFQRGYHGRRDIQLRPVHWYDGSRIHPLIERVQPGCWTIHQLHRHLRDELTTGGILAFERDAEYCGPAGVVLYHFDERRENYHLDCLVVAPQARRRGVGSQLLLELQQPLERNGCRERLTAMTFESNLAGQLFLRSAGFYLAHVLPKLRTDDGLQDGYVFSFDRLALRLANRWPPSLRTASRPRRQEC